MEWSFWTLWGLNLALAALGIVFVMRLFLS
jgi:hypothetical protein